MEVKCSANKSCRINDISWGQIDIFAGLNLARCVINKSFMLGDAM